MNKVPKINLFQEEHVYAAAKTWDSTPQKGGFRDGRLNYVIINGSEYPPKAIAAYACEHANTAILKPEDFKGGRKGIYLKQLEWLGFNIKQKQNRNPKEKQKKAALNSVIKLLSGNIKTEILTSILARLGQGAFRKSLMKKWGKHCAVSGNTCVAVLRASHIKRWADCTGKDSNLRLDPENGILLSANIDCLFETGLIGFKKTGELVKSKNLSTEQASASGIFRGMQLKHTPTVKQSELLDQHRRRHKLNNIKY